MSISVSAYTDYVCCPSVFDSDAEVKPIIGYGLFTFLRVPPGEACYNQSRCLVNETQIKDLIDWWNGTDGNYPPRNCTVNGMRTGANIMAIARNISPTLPNGTCPIVGNFVTGCMELDQADTVYTQTANIEANTSCCIDIQANNVTFNGDNYWIRNQTLNGSGICVDGFPDSEIHNTNVTMGPGTGGIGIYLDSADDAHIHNNILNDQNYGLSGNVIAGSIIENNTIEDNVFGMVLSSGNMEINNNFIKSNIRGISLDLVSTSLFFNNSITSNVERGISAYRTKTSNFSYTTTTNNYQGIVFENSSDNNIDHLTSNSNSNDSILLIDFSTNNYFSNFLLSSNQFGVTLINSSFNNFTDGIISPSSVWDVYAHSDSLKDIFLNVTYKISNESVSSDSNIIRKWYYQAYVNDTNGNPVDLVPVSAFNKSSDLEFPLVTGTFAPGFTDIYHIIDYANNMGTRDYYSNYTTSINTPPSHNLNISVLKNYLDIFTITQGCGNGILEPGEQCDDGNINDTDFCSYPNCMIKILDCFSVWSFCGNGICDVGETAATCPIDGC